MQTTTQPRTFSALRNILIISGTILLLTLIAVNYYAYRRDLSFHENSFDAEVSDITANVSEKFEAAMIGAESLSGLFTVSKEVDQDEFNVFAEILANAIEQTGLKKITLEWVDQNNSIQYVYPLNEENLKIIGVDLNRYPNRLTPIEKAKSTRSAVVTEPIFLGQGYPGLIIYVPVFKGDDYLGMTLSVVSLSDLVSSQNNPVYDYRGYLRASEVTVPLGMDVIYTLNGGRVVNPQGEEAKDESANMYLPNESEMVKTIIFADKAWEVRFDRAYMKDVNFRIILLALISLMFLGVLIYLFYLAYKRQEDIAKSKAKTDALFSSIGDGVIACDKDGNVVYANSVAADMSKIRLNELIGKQLYEVWPAVDSSGNPIRMDKRPYYQALATGKPVKSSMYSHYYMKRADGSKVAITSTASPIMVDGKVSGVIVTFADSSKEIEIDRMKSEFISLASHQLKAPLTAINWNIEMFLDGERGALTKEQKTALEEIHVSSNNMAELVAGFLNISKIEASGFVMDQGEVNFTDTVEGVIKELTPQANIKKINIKIENAGEPPMVNIGEKTAKIIAENLISNAIKYTSIGGDVVVKIQYENNSLIFCVQDTGYGIPESSKSSIFTKLYRAENIKEKESGTGLGLYMVKSFVDKLGGKIWFESEEGKGSKFFVQLKNK